MNMKSEKVFCVDCVYRGEDGVCQRFPPRVVKQGQYGEWPLTAAGDWCGEGRHK